MPSPNQYLLGGSDPSPILAPATPSQATPWYLDPQQRGAVTSVLSALAAPLTDAYQHASNLAQGRGDFGTELASGLIAAGGLAMPEARAGGAAAEAAEQLLPRAIKAAEWSTPHVDPVGILAYHGSPHDFAAEPGYPLGRFRDDKIGTGEGAQAFGHGHYAGGAEATAQSYRWLNSPPGLGAYPATLAKSARERAEASGLTGFDAKRAAIAYLNEQAQKAPTTGRQAVYDAINNYDELNSGRVGHMYEVNINADPEHFLDWDKPLSEQSEHVQGALNKIRAQALQDEGTKGSTLADVLKGDPLTGQIIGAHNLAYGGGKAEESLRQAGIPGIKYLDQGSRQPKILYNGAQIPDDNYAAKLAAEKLDLHGSTDRAIASLNRDATEGHPYIRDVSSQAADLLKNGTVAKHAPEGTHNYVVFDPSTIDIIRKYGISALMGGGAAAAGAGMTPQPAQAGQGDVADTIRALQSQ